MDTVLHSLIWALTVVGVVAMIVFGVSSCDERDQTLRETCIKSGGMVIGAGTNSFNCVRGTKVD